MASGADSCSFKRGVLLEILGVVLQRYFGPSINTLVALYSNPGRPIFYSRALDMSLSGQVALGQPSKQ